LGWVLQSSTIIICCKLHIYRHIGSICNPFPFLQQTNVSKLDYHAARERVCVCSPKLLKQTTDQFSRNLFWTLCYWRPLQPWAFFFYNQ
jgi:hypothetical protein